ncbi:MAG: hydroxyacid dehydrogenase [Flavobacteriales bacterium]|nr:hydroxyacid dehydrogenase [Flavobacteriales bacterium]
MKVLFIDTVHPVLEEKLFEHGFQVEHFTGWNRAECLCRLSGVQGIVIRSKFKIDTEFLNHALQLKFIARAGAGMENIDVIEAERRGVICINSPEGNRDAVGEHAIGMLLMLLNHLKRADWEVRQGIWKRAENRGTEIMGKTIGVIGYGNTGSRFVKKLMGFDARILVYDKYKKGFAESWFEESDMETIWNESDILSLHVPLTDETLYLVNESFIQRFKKPFVLINTSRGKVVKTADLVEAIKTGKISGACLDVLEYESASFEKLEREQLPDDFKYLLQAENVILTPHIAGWTHESNRKMSEILAEKIIQRFGVRIKR